MLQGFRQSDPSPNGGYPLKCHPFYFDHAAYFGVKYKSDCCLILGCFERLSVAKPGVGA